MSRDTRRPTGLILEPDHGYDGPMVLGLHASAPASRQQPTGPVRSQRWSDCVGCSLADAIYDHGVIQGIEKPWYPSASWIYYQARREAGREAYDEGSQPSKALDAIRKYGVCDEKYLPYGSLDPLDQPSLEAMRHAYDQRGRIRLRTISTMPDELRVALAQDVCVCLAIQVDASFESLASRGPWIQTGPTLGYHAIRCVGYEPAGLVVKNSWGEDWGAGGFAVIAWGALFDGTIRDAWGVDWVPSASEDIPPEVA